MENKLIVSGNIEDNDTLKGKIKEIGKWLQETDFNVDIENNLVTSIDINIHINPKEIINCDFIQNFGVYFKGDSEDEQ